MIIMIVVVCSAGVGRTGTFILIDRLLQHIQHESTIDIFGTILEMRGYRSNMIQTEVSRRAAFAYPPFSNPFICSYHEQQLVAVGPGNAQFMSIRQVSLRCGTYGPLLLRPLQQHCCCCCS